MAEENGEAGGISFTKKLLENSQGMSVVQSLEALQAEALVLKALYEERLSTLCSFQKYLEANPTLTQNQIMASEAYANWMRVANALSLRDNVFIEQSLKFSTTYRPIISSLKSATHLDAVQKLLAAIDASSTVMSTIEQQTREIYNEVDRLIQNRKAS